MVEEDVTIRVRERGAKATARGIKQVGRSSRKAKVAVVALVGALTTFVGIRGLAQIGKEAISAASSFEQFGIRLGALLGSQKEANVALDNFVTLAGKTPFAVSEIVEGASALGAAAIGNREKLEELTQTAANLAAVTGLSFREAASNLQRALSAGIGAADLFRERGVRALIESISGIPDATKLTKDELDKAFADVFGRGGIFGRAAEDLSSTLGGALSNIGDAATNARVALGQAFAPAVIAGARQALIPFLVRLKDLFEDNKEEITEFAAQGVTIAIKAFIALTRVGLTVIQSFSDIKKLGGDLIGTFLELQLTINEIDLSIQTGVPEFFQKPELIAETTANISRLKTQIDGLAAESADAERANEKFTRGLDAINEELANLDRLASRIDFGRTTAPVAPDVVLPKVEGGVESTEQLAKRKAAEAKILQITKQLRITSAGRVSQLDAQLERLNQQAATLREQALLAGDQGLASFGLLEIEAQRRDIALERLATAKEETKEAARLRAQLAQEVGGQLSEAIRTGGKSAVADLSAFTETQMNEALGEAILGAQDAIADVFSSAFESIDFGSLFGGASSGLGAAFGAALGVGAAILTKELGGTSSKSRKDLVKTAVESSEATRGVVAGPTSVPVFQVGQQIEEALGGTELRLDRILEAILAQPIGGAAGGAGGPDRFASSLSSTTPSLV